MVHVSIAIEKVTQQGRSGLFLAFSSLFGLLLVVSVTIVPGRSVRLPRSQANPAKVSFASLVFANHVIAATIFFNDGATSRTLFGVGRNPVGRLRIIVALLDPFLDQMTTYRIVPVLRTGETERMAAITLDRSGLNMRDFDSVGTIGRRAPPHQTVALNEAVGD